MNKTVQLFCLFVFFNSATVSGQDSASVRSDIYKTYKQHDRLAMSVLLGWGLTSTLGGIALARRPETKHAGLMHATWGVINTGIASAAFLFYSRASTPEAMLAEMQSLQNIVIINSLLDIGYLSAGAGMLYFGKTDRVTQFGRAVLIQGAFLTAFDAALLVNTNRHLARWNAAGTSIYVSMIHPNTLTLSIPLNRRVARPAR